MKCILVACFACMVLFSFSQNSLNIIPVPVKAEIKEGTFTITPATKLILAGSGSEKSAAFLNSYLKKFYGFQLQVSKQQNWKNAVVLNYNKFESSILGAYELTVDADKVHIGGDNEQGIFYAVQTLLQLLPIEKSQSLNIQQCNIVDSPRFAYRGLMLDCGRHFFSGFFCKAIH